MVGNFMQQGISIITVSIFTRILTEYDYGNILTWCRKYKLQLFTKPNG